MRKKLYEHTWVEIAKSESNPSQSLRRLRDEANRSINDLTLLAQKLPNDTLKDIFNEASIGKLVVSILRMDYNESDDREEDDLRLIQLAAGLVETGVRKCSMYYKQKVEENSVLSKPITSQLHEAANICKQISLKVKMPQIQAAGEKEDLTYLFDWSKIDDTSSEDYNRFQHFCYGEFPDEYNDPIESIDRISQISGNVMSFDLIDLYGSHIRGHMWLHMENNDADFIVEDTTGERRIKQRLVYRRDGNNVYIYKKKE